MTTPRSLWLWSLITAQLSFRGIRLLATLTITAWIVSSPAAARVARLRLASAVAQRADRLPDHDHMKHPQSCGPTAAAAPALPRCTGDGIPLRQRRG